MKSWLGIVLLGGCALLWASSARCQAGRGLPEISMTESGFILTASVDRSWGTTRYTMDALARDPRDPNTVVPIRSRLEFPLDAALLGLQLAWRPGAETGGRWTLTAGLRTDVGDAAALMTDSDFFGDRQIAYAESDPQIDLWFATAELRRRLGPDSDGRYALLARVDYENIHQNVVGFTGWQGSMFSDTRVPIVETAPALDYELTYLSVDVGAVARIDIVRRLALHVEGAGGLLLAWDRDDHLLRGRVSEGRATGFSLRGGAHLAWTPPVFGGSRLAVELRGNLRYHRAEGGVDQTWYVGADTGVRYSDLPYTLESFMPSAGLAVTVAF